MLTSMLLLLLLVVADVTSSSACVPAVGRILDVVLDKRTVVSYVLVAGVLDVATSNLRCVTSIMKQKLYENIKIAPRNMFQVMKI